MSGCMHAHFLQSFSGLSQLGCPKSQEYALACMQWVLQMKQWECKLGACPKARQMIKSELTQGTQGAPVDICVAAQGWLPFCHSVTLQQHHLATHTLPAFTSYGSWQMSSAGDTCAS